MGAMGLFPPMAGQWRSRSNPRRCDRSRPNPSPGRGKPPLAKNVRTSTCACLSKRQVALGGACTARCKTPCKNLPPPVGTGGLAPTVPPASGRLAAWQAEVPSACGGGVLEGWSFPPAAGTGCLAPAGATSIMAAGGKAGRGAQCVLWGVSGRAGVWQQYMLKRSDSGSLMGRLPSGSPEVLVPPYPSSAASLEASGGVRPACPQTVTRCHGPNPSPGWGSKQ